MPFQSQVLEGAQHLLCQLPTVRRVFRQLGADQLRVVRLVFIEASTSAFTSSGSAAPCGHIDASQSAAMRSCVTRRAGAVKQLKRVPATLAADLL